MKISNSGLSTRLKLLPKCGNTAFLLKNLQIRVFSLIYGYKRKQLKEYIPPHVHMHALDPYCRI